MPNQGPEQPSFESNRQKLEAPPLPKKIGLKLNFEQNNLEKLNAGEDKEEKNKIREIDSVLTFYPDLNMIRTHIYELVQQERLDREEVPSWADNTITGEVLYREGWNASSLKQNIKAWEEVLKHEE